MRGSGIRAKEFIGIRWRAAMAWLANVPVADPIDRRNAFVMQVIFIVIGCELPGLHAYYIAVSRYTHFPWGVIDVGGVVLNTVSAWVGLWMVRRGQFRAAVIMFLCATLIQLAAAYFADGLRAMLLDPLFPTLSLVISGLVLGRPALWTTFSSLQAFFLLGAVSDSFGWSAMKTPIPRAYSFLLPMFVSYFAITLIIDRAMSALRESVAKANEKSQLLQLSNARLHTEMDEREQAQERLIHAQKLETVGRVASGVAHDFDNVLGVIMGYAQRREQLSYGGIDTLVQALEGIELAARRGKAVSRRMLSFSRHEVAKMEVFDVVAGLRELMPMVRQIFAANVHVELRACDEPLPICFDIAQFELVVLNIAANARDAMPEGGRFVMEAHRNSAGDQIEIALIDSGHGISDDVKAHMFDAFYTTKPTGQGTGLGLAMVKDLVTHAGGSIAAKSVPHQGTRFYIRLPYAASLTA